MSFLKIIITLIMLTLSPTIYSIDIFTPYNTTPIGFPTHSQACTAMADKDLSNGYGYSTCSPTINDLCSCTFGDYQGDGSGPTTGNYSTIYKFCENYEQANYSTSSCLDQGCVEGEYYNEFTQLCELINEIDPDPECPDGYSFSTTWQTCLADLDDTPECGSGTYLDVVSNSCLPSDNPTDDDYQPTSPSPEDQQPDTPQPAPVTDDGDTTPTEATDENQEQMSEQLEGMSGLLQEIENNTDSLERYSDGVESLLGSIDESLKTRNDNSEIENLLRDIKENTSDREAPETVGNVLDCTTTPSCSGSVIQCAIVKANHKISCLFEDTGESIALDSDIDEQLKTATGATENLDEYFADKPENTFDISTYLILPALTTGTCPAPITTNTSIGSFDWSLQPFCDLAQYIRPLVILMAYITAMLMLHNSLLGGRP